MEEMSDELIIRPVEAYRLSTESIQRRMELAKESSGEEAIGEDLMEEMTCALGV